MTTYISDLLSCIVYFWYCGHKLLASSREFYRHFNGLLKQLLVFVWYEHNEFSGQTLALLHFYK